MNQSAPAAPRHSRLPLLPSGPDGDLDEDATRCKKSRATGARIRLAEKRTAEYPPATRATSPRTRPVGPLAYAHGASAPYRAHRPPCILPSLHP